MIYKIDWSEGKKSELYVEVKSEKELRKLFVKAEKIAKKNPDFFGTTSDIPEEVLKEAGVCLVEVRNGYVENNIIRKTELEEKGIRKASCDDCWSCDSGVCMHYGGLTNPEDAEGCGHFSNDAGIEYDGLQYIYDEVLTKKKARQILDIYIGTDED